MSQKLTIKATGINGLGEGIYKIGKDEFTCPYLLPKEEAVIEVNRERGIKTRLLKVVKPSPDRVDPKCSIYYRCGSCQLLHMNYESQVKFKKDYVLDCFKKQNIKIKIDEFIEAENKTRYRNKMQVAFKYQDRKLVYGFYEEATHKIIPVDDCLVQTEKQNKVIKTCCDILENMKIAPYQEDKRTGIIRFILIKEAIKTNELMVVVVTNTPVFPGSNEFVRRLTQKEKSVTTIIQNINTRHTSIILGDNERVLYGKGYISEFLNNMKFKITSKSFFQVNPIQTEKLYSKVIEFGEFTSKDVVMDAYSGVGTIGMIISPFVGNVISVENNKQAVQAAIDNLKYNNIKNVRVYNDDATEFMIKKQSELKIDVLVLDPPRSGSTEKFLNAAIKLKPKKIIYVSCEASTLARDCQILLKEYKIVKTALVDLFVGTYHVETICSLERR